MRITSTNSAPIPMRTRSVLRLAGLAMLTLAALSSSGLHASKASGLQAFEPSFLLWGGDAEGGAPFVEADPHDPSRVVGLDVDIATLIARALGREPRFVQITFTSLDQSAARGDFDLGLSGIEDTPARRAAVAATMPYYEFREVLTVRAPIATGFARSRT